MLRASVSSSLARSASPTSQANVAASTVRAVPALPDLRRRQPARQLRQLGRRGKGTSVPCALRRVRERGRDVLVRTGRSQGHVPGSLLRVRQNLCQAAMDRAALARVGLGVHTRGEQRMGEADAVPVELDHVAGDGGREPIAGSSSGSVPHELERRVRKCGRCQQRRLRIVWKQHEPVAHQSRERAGQRLARLEPDRPAADRATKFERVERVPAGQLAQSPELGSRKDELEPVAQEPVKRTGAQRADTQATQRAIGQDAFEIERGRRLLRVPQRQQKPDLLRAQATERELQHEGGRTVEPLEIVDRDEHGLGLGEDSQRPQDGNRYSPLVRGLPFGFGDQERHGEGVCLRRRERREHLLERVSQKVAESDE